MSTLPTAAQVRELPATSSHEVTPDLVDENGHMNIVHYFMAASRGVWEVTNDDLGVDDDYRAGRRMSFFTVEHHVRYHAEMREGGRYSVHPQLLARSGKAAHAISYVVDDTDDRLACSLELAYVHVSLDERRAVPIPDDVAARLDAVIAKHATAWPPPLSGAIGVR